MHRFLGLRINNSESAFSHPLAKTFNGISRTKIRIGTNTPTQITTTKNNVLEGSKLAADYPAGRKGKYPPLRRAIDYDSIPLATALVVYWKAQLFLKRTWSACVHISLFSEIDSMSRFEICFTCPEGLLWPKQVSTEKKNNWPALKENVIFRFRWLICSVPSLR